MAVVRRKRCRERTSLIARFACDAITRCPARQHQGHHSAPEWSCRPVRSPLFRRSSGMAAGRARRSHSTQRKHTMVQLIEPASAADRHPHMHGMSQRLSALAAFARCRAVMQHPAGALARGPVVARSSLAASLPDQTTNASLLHQVLLRSCTCAQEGTVLLYEIDDISRRTISGSGTNPCAGR